MPAELADLQAWLQTGGLGAVCAVLFFMLYRLVWRLLDLQKDTTEVIERNTDAVKAVKDLGTEQMSELRAMNLELHSRPCIVPPNQTRGA